METTLNEIVEEMIVEHTEGTAFFDALDEKVRIPLYFTKMMRLYYSMKYHRPFTRSVVSGKFGLYFLQWARRPNTPWSMGSIPLVVNGNLREEAIIDLSPLRVGIKDTHFVFFDDSFFQGRTRDKIEAELTRNGGKLIHTIVVYDGSKELDSRVSSLYRFYDNYWGE